MEHKDLVSWHDAAMQGTHPMTQPDNLQQAYDRAMAHNAMLREALGKYEEVYPYVCDLKDNAFMAEHHEGLTQVINLWLRYGRVALNATGPDVEAWMINFQNKSIDTTIKLYESEMQQLATVTAERDALRELQATVVCLYESRGGRNPYVEIALWERVHVELYRLKALAQKADT